MPPTRRHFCGGLTGTRTPDPLLATPHLSFRSSNIFGGPMGTRTPDPLLAKQMLYQLSYWPQKIFNRLMKGAGLPTELSARKRE